MFEKYLRNRSNCEKNKDLIKNGLEEVGNMFQNFAKYPGKS